MRRKGFEPTIPVFERTKTFHALDLKIRFIKVSNQEGAGILNAEMTDALNE
jgi:hypothetical protein